MCELGLWLLSLGPDLGIPKMNKTQIAKTSHLLQVNLSIYCTHTEQTPTAPPQRDRKRASAQKRDSWDCSLSPACSEQPYSAEIYPAKRQDKDAQIKSCQEHSGTQWKPLDWCFGDQTSVKYKKKPGRLHSWARQWTVLLDHPCMCWFKLAGSPWCGELPNMVLQVTVDAFLLLDPLLVTGVESSWGWMDTVPTSNKVVYDFGDSWKISY